MKPATVYIGMSADVIHHGLVNVIEKGAEYGSVVVGLLTDRAVTEYKRLPVLNYEHRKRILENVKGVAKVIPQETWDYVPNLRALKPDWMVHGDDWKTGPQSFFRQKAIEAMQEWNGRLIEIPYTRDVSSSEMEKSMRAIGTTPANRQKSLRRLLEAKPLVRFLEVHHGLSGLIVENAETMQNDQMRRFDGMWSSSLTDSTAKGKPDIEAVDLTSRLNVVNEIFEVTTKPMIFDGDTGGKTEHFAFLVRSLERTGVSAVIIEDKTGLKKNSLFGNEVPQTQDSVESFCDKINTGKKAQIAGDFMVIARIESLILDRGMDDALRRADAYVKAGADGLMIHSRKKEKDEVFEFCAKRSPIAREVPLVVVPTSYDTVTEEELADAGVNVCIYANHLLRSSYPAMMKTALSILKHSRARESGEHTLSINEILELIPGTK